MNEVALITGASTGIGAEFARIHAFKGRDVVLVARSADKLNALASELEQEHGIRTVVLARDLSDPDLTEQLPKELKDQGIEVEYLINNAGFGELIEFEASDPDTVQRMIALNIEALTLLTHTFGKEMLEQGKGHILNVASTAAFQPGPYMAVYYASKSYVLSFSRAVHHEWRKRGVSVTTLCPGPTSSEFVDRAGMQGVPLFENMKPHSSRYVAERGYHAMEKGRRLTVPGLMNKMGTLTAPLLPTGLVMRLVERLHDK